jgi:steroid delta-isomerase-like uncharacterized protein
MTIEDNKVLSRRFYEAYDKNDRAAFEGMMSPDCVVHLSGMEPMSRAAFMQVSEMFVASFTDSHTTFEDQIAEEDRVVTRWVWRITQTKEFQGIPATGKRVALTGMTLNRIKDGKIVEQWVNFDQLGLLQQLGALPAPGESAR